MKMATDLKSVTTGRVRNLTTQMVVPTLLIAVIVGNPARGASNDDGTDHRDANRYGRIDHVALMWPISTRALHFTPVCFGYRKSSPPLRVAAGSRWARTSLCISWVSVPLQWLTTVQYTLHSQVTILSRSCNA
jgi:hypothetical protein